MGRKTNISDDKQAKLAIAKKKKTLREKLDFFW